MYNAPVSVWDEATWKGACPKIQAEAKRLGAGLGKYRKRWYLVREEPKEEQQQKQQKTQHKEGGQQQKQQDTKQDLREKFQVLARGYPQQKAARRAFRQLALVAHPDRGGSNDLMHTLNEVAESWEKEHGPVSAAP